MKKLIPALLFFISTFAYTQNEFCDGSRYIDDIFTETKVTTGIKYGENTEINGTFKELFLDVYEPVDDPAESRPLIMVAFGGSFISGAREDVAPLCESFARKGYVAVAIDYRLYDGALFPLPTAIQMQEVVIKAVSDMKGAIRYMKHDAATDNIFKIDPSMVFTSGISAGSIAACHAAVLDSTDTFDEELQAIIEANGGIEGNTNDLEYNTDVQGYINYSGGLADASWMDENDPPFHSVHDEFDPIVPYGEGFASVFGFDIIYMEGSRVMHETADELGVVNELTTFEGSEEHVGYFFSTDEITASVINESAAFLSNIVCEIISNTNDNNITLASVYPNPTSDILTIGTDGQLYDVNIYNIFGQRIISENNTRQLDVSFLPKGNYSIQIMNENTKQKSHQLVSIIR